MKISIGSDHRGLELKHFLQKALPNITWHDVGALDAHRSDYPEFAELVCKEIIQSKAAAGVLICGSGIGMSIAANRHKKIYAALCWNPEIARLAKEDDGANVLVLPSDFVSGEQALAIFNAWAQAIFKGGRYADRLDMLDQG